MIQNINNTNEFINEIAVIGMSGRFPGARNISEFWENLKAGRETIKRFTDEELEPFEIDYESLKHNPAYIKSRGILDDIDKFDASFFGLNPKEASILDPQQRIWLEVAWEALESSGYNTDNKDILIGVIAGSYFNNYLIHNLFKNRQDVEEFVRFRGLSYYSNIISNDNAYLPTRTSYKLNLKGPSINVQTACSTSLVAISMACQSLLNFESDIVIAGGICIALPQESGYIFQKDAIYSKDGHCKSFDADSSGSVFSNGAGAVVLKRLEEAIEDRDNILAVIKGAAINNDGSTKVSFMAPSVDGQAQVIAAAQSIARVHPETITYVEAHGTGTPIGDPIEFAALNKVFSSRTNAKQFCGIGSVKSNIGHLDAAAGVTGFIKTVLAIQHKQLPPTLHFKNPNPEIDFENSPFYVVDKLTDWNPKGFPRRAGVSSFGIGGTNAHVIVEEAPVLITDAQSKPYQLLVLSAKTETALDASIKNLESFIKQNPHLSIPDVAYTLANGRREFEFRCFIIDKNEDLRLTAEPGFKSIIKGKAENSARNIDTTKDVMTLQRKSFAENTGWESLLSSIGKLWISGVSIDWKAFYGNEKRRFVSVPTYPFERKRFWVDPPVYNAENGLLANTNIGKDSYKNNKSIPKNDKDKSAIDDIFPYEMLNDRKKKISVIIQDELLKLSGLDSDKIDYSKAFANYGFDSLFLAGFAVALEKKFKIEIKFRQLNADYPNIERLAAYINSQLFIPELHSASQNKTKTEKLVHLAPIQPEGSKNPFFLVHGDAITNKLPDYLDKDQPFYGYFHPGSDGEPVTYTSIEDIANHYVNELLKVKPEGPYLLGGYSFGGIMAYEMAQILIAKGAQIDLLVLIDTAYPKDKQKLSLFIILKKLFYGLPRKIIRLTIKDKICNLYIFNKKPLPVILRNYYIFREYFRFPRYFPKPINCSIAYLQATQNTEYDFIDSDKMWRALINGDMYLCEVPGNHSTIISKPENFKVMAEHIIHYLNKAQNK